MTRNFIKAREYIVVFAIALAMIITGSFVDLGFSKAVYSYTERILAKSNSVRRVITSYWKFT